MYIFYHLWSLYRIKSTDVSVPNKNKNLNMHIFINAVLTNLKIQLHKSARVSHDSVIKGSTLYHPKRARGICRYLLSHMYMKFSHSWLSESRNIPTYRANVFLTKVIPWRLSRPLKRVLYRGLGFYRFITIAQRSTFDARVPAQRRTPQKAAQQSIFNSKQMIPTYGRDLYGNRCAHFTKMLFHIERMLFKPKKDSSANQWYFHCATKKNNNMIFYSYHIMYKYHNFHIKVFCLSLINNV